MPAMTTIVGNLVRDPEEKEFGPDKNITKIRVACTDRMPDGNGGWKDGDTAFYDVVCWRTLAENVSSNLSKGNKVIVHGKLKYREFDRKDGTRGNAFEIDATDVGSSLSIKSGTFNKTSNVSNSTVSVGAEEPDPWA